MHFCAYASNWEQAQDWNQIKFKIPFVVKIPVIMQFDNDGIWTKHLNFVDIEKGYCVLEQHE